MVTASRPLLLHAAPCPALACAGPGSLPACREDLCAALLTPPDVPALLPCCSLGLQGLADWLPVKNVRTLVPQIRTVEGEWGCS